MAKSRAEVKWQVFRDRSPAGDGDVTCELCGSAPASDLHEIVNRAVFKPEYMDIYPVELYSCLCNPCNVNIADAKTSRRLLLKKNIAFYGSERVKKALVDFLTAIGALISGSYTL